jgi:hypothetical protein
VKLWAGDRTRGRHIGSRNLGKHSALAALLVVVLIGVLPVWCCPPELNASCRRSAPIVEVVSTDGAFRFIRL